jgi:2-polyprenyl-3-methyl-5-hydroxy-6-metoxy-1,4-benzoquinol methylase
MIDRPTPRAAGKDEHEAQIDSIESWFGSHAGDWKELYRDARRVNDVVLIDRLRIATGFLGRLVPTGGRILDAGCGAGWASLDLARAGYAVHGVDVAQEMIDQCEETFAREGVPKDRYAFTRGELLQVDLPPESFDGVAALGVLQYQVDEGPVLRSFHRLLRPDGVLVITGPIARGLPNYFGAVGQVTGFVRSKLLRKPPRPMPTRHRYSLRRFRRLLDAAGFEVVGYKGHGFGDWVIVGGLIGAPGERVLHRFFSWLARITPVGLWGNDLVVAARKRSA